MASLVADVDDGTFQSEVLKSALPVLVLFWAPWDGPSRIALSLVDQMVKLYGASLKVVKVNVDESPVSAQDHLIRTLPGYFVYKNGQVLDRYYGPITKDSLSRFVSGAI
jgi:thioredoxin 1